MLSSTAGRRDGAGAGGEVGEGPGTPVPTRCLSEPSRVPGSQSPSEINNGNCLTPD